MRTTIVLISYFLLSLLPMAATPGLSRHRFHLDYTDGLSNNFVRGITQDKHGFVWVATIDGLNRFDGRRLVSFTKENSGLTSNELNDVIADPKNPDILWIGSRHDGLCKYDYSTGSITTCKENLKSTDIPDLTISSDSNIWVAYYHFPPEKYNPSTGEITKLYDNIPSGFKTRIWCIVEDKAGKYLYIGHDGEGLTRINLEDKKFRNFMPTDNDGVSIGGSHIYTIHIDKYGKVWCGTENGISIFSPSTGKFQNITHQTINTLPPGWVKCIYELSDGSLWIGTDKGGVCMITDENIADGNYQFHNRGLKRDNSDRNDYPSYFITKIFEDSFGNVWVGTQSNGLDIFSYEAPFFIQEEPFPTFNGKPVNQSVWSTVIDDKGNLWIGGENRILNFSNHNRTAYYLPLTNGGNTMVCALHCDKKGNIWVGTANSGVFIFNPIKEQFSTIEIPEKEIRCFAEDKDGNILIGTHDGIYKSKDDITAGEAKDLTSKTTDKYIMSMAFDNDGSLWIGTYGKGVYIVSPTLGVENISQDNILPSNTINDIFEDSNGNMWIATRNGLARVSKDNHSDFTIYNNENGLLNNDIKGIEEDNDGNIWISSNRGIGMFDPKTGKMTAYHKTYGKNLFSYSEGSAAKCGNCIYFGSLNGITHFNPSRLKKNQHDSEIMVSNMYAHDKNADDQNMRIMIPVNSKEIKLPYNLNTFTITFCNPDITQAANSDYVYNMKGVNEVWTPVGENNEALYRSLRPGKYEFRVRHRLNGEYWSEADTLLTIIITPPIYLTWWAKLLYVVIAFVLVTLMIYFYKHKIDLEKNLAIEREKSKNDQKINEERMVFFTNITHELRTPLSLIVGPIEDLVNDTDMKPEHRKKLLTIRTSSMRLLNLINGILEFRKTETQNKRLEVTYGNFANFIREVGIRFKELNNNPELNFAIDVAEMEGIEMYYDPEVVTIILNNLLGNAIKYTKSGTITLALHPLTVGGVRYVDLKVSDTGEGISKNALPHIFERYYQAKHNRKVSGTGIGLALTKNLVELHEGTIAVRSEQGKGSEFTVRLIVDNSYPNALHKEVDEQAEEQAINQPNPSAVNDRLTVLVVEDDDDVREYIAQAFSDDFNIVTASDGKEGLDKALQLMPDMIVSDIMMPEMDGIELCTRIKSESAVSHIPVILLTAKDSLPDKEQGYAAGADSYITKPFSATLLKARINNILESRHRLTMLMLDNDMHLPAKGGVDNPTTPQPEPTPQEQPQQAELTPFDREFIEKFKRLTEENIEIDDLDIAFFTDKMCMSHSTLYRKVKSITGYTPNEFIRKIKIHKAAEMLMSGKVAISEIPFKTGFNSAAYFRRVFKKEFGVSPSEYVSKPVKYESNSDQPLNAE